MTIPFRAKPFTQILPFGHSEPHLDTSSALDRFCRFHQTPADTRIAQVAPDRDLGAVAAYFDCDETLDAVMPPPGIVSPCSEQRRSVQKEALLLRK